MDGVALRAARAMGSPALRSRALAGGQMEEVSAVELADGRIVVAKGGPAPMAEARMLRALGGAGAPVPAVLAASDDVLVLELLPSDGDVGVAWGHLGEVLGRLHGHSSAAAGAAGRYGWPEPYAFGRLAIPNEPHDDWPTFWAERRLLPHVGRLPSALARRVESLAAGLAERLPSEPTPSLLHGDLWGGNVVVASGRVSGLVDPAASVGHAEVDLAMLTLFDRPAPAFWDAYGRLDPGAEERRPIYALWPAVVHVAIFGASYVPLVERLLRTTHA